MRRRRFIRSASGSTLDDLPALKTFECHRCSKNLPATRAGWAADRNSVMENHVPVRLGRPRDLVVFAKHRLAPIKLGRVGRHLLKLLLVQHGHVRLASPAPEHLHSETIARAEKSLQSVRCWMMGVESTHFLRRRSTFVGFRSALVGNWSDSFQFRSDFVRNRSDSFRFRSAFVGNRSD